MAEIVTDTAEMENVSKVYAGKYNGQSKDFVSRYVAGTNTHLLYKMKLTSLELFDELRHPGGAVVAVF